MQRRVWSTCRCCLQNGMLGALPRQAEEDDTAEVPLVPASRVEDDIDIPDFLKNVN